MKIQKPSQGRVVLFTAFRGNEEKATDEYTALITRAHDTPGFVDLVTFGSQSVYFQHKVAFDADGGAGTWRYPPHVKEEIEV